MSRYFKIQTQGLDKVLKNIDKYGKDVATCVDDELSEAARNVATMAKLSAPRHTNIAATISAITTKQYSKEVQVAHPRAAYEEFGTGRFVFIGPYQFNADQKEFAKQFYVNGLGKTRAHPYLFPAFDVEIPKLLKRIQDVLRKNIR